MLGGFAARAPPTRFWGASCGPPELRFRALRPLRLMCQRISCAIGRPFLIEREARLAEKHIESNVVVIPKSAGVTHEYLPTHPKALAYLNATLELLRNKESLVPAPASGGATDYWSFR